MPTDSRRSLETAIVHALTNGWHVTTRTSYHDQIIYTGEATA